MFISVTSDISELENNLLLIITCVEYQFQFPSISAKLISKIQCVITAFTAYGIDHCVKCSEHEWCSELHSRRID